MARNPFWPGWYTFFSPIRKSWSHIYLGDGVKARQQFIPNKLSDFLKEPKDVNEHDEPNHYEAPKPEGDGEEEENEEEEED